MLVVPAHAKVNLALEVTGRRPDGWHDIDSVISAIDWHDLVGVRAGPRRDAAAITLRLTGPFAEGIPGDAGNLAHRAATALLTRAGDPRLALDLWVCKLVPAAAGLGGGSADAAAVLRAGAALFAAHGVRLSAAELEAAAAELGSDVPAVLRGGTVRATARGDQLAGTPAPVLHLAIAVAGPSSTHATYQALTDDERQAAPRRTQQLAAALEEAASAREPTALPAGAALESADRRASHRLPTSLAQLRPQLGSALEPAACRASPGLADSLARLRALTPEVPWHLTGSGGAAFALAHDKATAGALADAARHAGFPARACRTLPHPHAAPTAG
jgi:4-diphosphocytidyl-2-C-methyl-D-erythritol kinase